MKQIKINFAQFYYVLKCYLFKLLLHNPQARKLIAKKCSEDIIFWLEFFVKLPPQSHCEEQSYEAIQNQPTSHNSNPQNNAAIAWPGQNQKNTPQFLDYHKKYILEIKSRIETGKPLIVEKSRAMGATTCTALVLLWFWLYREESNFFILSRVKNDLYKISNPQSIFMLYKYVLENLPYYLFSNVIEEETEKEEPPLKPQPTCHCEKRSDEAIAWSSQEPANNQTNQQSPLKKDFQDPISPGEIFFKNAEQIRGIGKHERSVGNQQNLCDSFGQAFFLKGGKKEPKNIKPYKILINRKKKYYIKLINTNNGNTLWGFTGAQRYYFVKNYKIKAVWYDDMAFQRHQTEHWESLKSLTECYIATSCPNGSYNMFDTLAHKNYIDRYRLIWHLNPKYDRQWYEKMCKSLDYEEVNQFLNIDYDHKVKRKTTPKITQPQQTENKELVKTAASTVKIPQISTARNKSTFLKTFSEPVKRQRFRSPKEPMSPFDFDTIKKRLMTSAYSSINFPKNRFNLTTSANIVTDWQKIVHIIDQSNLLTLSSAKTAVSIVKLYEPRLITMMKQYKITKVSRVVNSAKLTDPQAKTITEIFTFLPSMQKWEEKENRRLKSSLVKQDEEEEIRKIYKMMSLDPPPSLLQEIRDQKSANNKDQSSPPCHPCMIKT